MHGQYIMFLLCFYGYRAHHYYIIFFILLVFGMVSAVLGPILDAMRLASQAGTETYYGLELLGQALKEEDDEADEQTMPIAPPTPPTS